MDYLQVLKAIKELPFPVGKNLLTDILVGEETNKSIIRNKLFRLECFGSLAYTSKETKEMIEKLLYNGLISYTRSGHFKVLVLTGKGLDELENPTKKEKFKEVRTTITKEDKELFSKFDFFLKRFNEEQKKAIISDKERIVCIAGPGSGKTSVLAKRIEFLTKFKGVNPKEVLAITFTRKARDELKERIDAPVIIETFNSLSEKLIQRRSQNDNSRVMTYRDRIICVRKALKSKSISPRDALKIYYSDRKLNSNTLESLFFNFINDCFTIVEYYKREGKELNDFSYNPSSKIVYEVCKYIKEYMKENMLRDYTDQLIQAHKLFNKKYEYVLVDEYQDVNNLQVKLTEKISKNLFVVGDPRQSIYGWRGSDVSFINNFDANDKIVLTKNYRSKKKIVDFFNLSAEKFNLSKLESQIKEEGEVEVKGFKTFEKEIEYVYAKLIKENFSKVFILARTNKILMDTSEFLKNKGVKHYVKKETTKEEEDVEERIILSTIHSIKGLEAEAVFLINCTNTNFPSKASDHPVIDMLNLNNYDKESEERRLFYVALSRAKNYLCVTYTKTPSYFLTTQMIDFSQNKELDLNLVEKLKEWRLEKSKSSKRPPFMVLHDSTIKDLALKKPTHILELEEIPGFGPSKITLYGKEIVNIIKKQNI
ncbi:MAG: UvrD-helicase domain-containing protein [Candidatus Woesearchaeota archaeon]